MKFKTFAALLSSLVIAACGGGGAQHRTQIARILYVFEQQPKTAFASIKTRFGQPDSREYAGRTLELREIRKQPVVKLRDGNLSEFVQQRRYFAVLQGSCIDQNVARHDSRIETGSDKVRAVEQRLTGAAPVARSARQLDEFLIERIVG